MVIVVVGLSHRTVPLEYLERVSFARAEIPKALATLNARDEIFGCVVLSTCHRTEIYAAAPRFHDAVEIIESFLADHASVRPDELSDDCYTFHDDFAVSHLFEVVSGVDSVVPGETEILGQVRDSWMMARDESTTSPAIDRLFDFAIGVGRRVRTQTGIARGATSIAHAGIAQAADALGSLADTRLAVVGAGKMAESIARGLVVTNPASLTIYNRSLESAQRLISALPQESVSFDSRSLWSLADELNGFDAVFCAVSSPEPVISGVTPPRPHEGSTLLIDLGVPRNVDPGVGNVAGFKLVDLDSLKAFVSERLEQRREEVETARALISGELEDFRSVRAARELAPALQALYDHAEELRVSELSRWDSKLKSLSPEQLETVHGLTRGLIQKLLHRPAVELKAAATRPEADQVLNSLRSLFGLDA